MCLSIPAEVIAVDGLEATVSVGGIQYKASLQLVDDVHPGDYVLLHTGFALEKINKEEAEETLRTLRSLDENYDFLPEE